MLIDLFCTLCSSVVFILALTTDKSRIPNFEFTSCDRSAEDAYSSLVPDPTFAFVGVLVTVRSTLYNYAFHRIMITFNKLFTSSIDLKETVL
jgi:hypothetical protein